jgi:hypothetical protein
MDASKITGCEPPAAEDVEALATRWPAQFWLERGLG